MTETVKTKRPIRGRGPVAARLIAETIRLNGGTANVKVIAAALNEAGYFSVNGNIQQALKTGLIARSRPGVYTLPDPA